MVESKDKGELLVIANLAEQAERYDGKYSCTQSVTIIISGL